jgi:hypothetical protein
MIGNLELRQIVLWDETHRKCLIGGLTNRNFTVVAKRCLPFNYSEKVLLSVLNYEKKMAAEILRVKNLTAKASYWVETNMSNGVLCLDDPINMLKGVGKVLSK